MRIYHHDELSGPLQAFFCFGCQAWFCRCGKRFELRAEILEHLFGTTQGFKHTEIKTIVYNRVKEHFYACGINTAIEGDPDEDNPKHEHSEIF